MRRDGWLFWGLIFGGLALLTTGAVIVYNQTRGLRNNNPGNIRKGTSTWQGMSPQQTDSAFVQFTSPEYGIRALGKLLSNYYAQGLTTAAQMIAKFAPPSDNNPTAAYARNVAAHIGKGANDQIALAIDLRGLVEGIIQQENGINPYPSAIISKGLSLI